MKASILLSGCILFFLQGCHFTDEKSRAVPKKKTIDTKAVHKKIIHKELYLPQAKPFEGQYCLIKKDYLQNGTRYIDADYMQFFMGKDAINAARKKGEAEMVLDDYYILNENTKIRKLPLAKDVVIQLISTEKGQSFFVDGDEATLHQKMKDGIFVLLIENDVVQNIKEQFLP